jgi:hypothetical protein
MQATEFCPRLLASVHGKRSMAEFHLLAADSYEHNFRGPEFRGPVAHPLLRKGLLGDLSVSL